MPEYISRETLRDLMYTEAFDRDTGLQRWDSGLWIRFKLFENCLDAIPAADVVERPRWIPVTERLPEDGSLVGKLIADSDGNIRIAGQCAVITLSGGKAVYTDLIDLVSFLAEETPTTEWADCTHITHWMPLPEPPKEVT